MEATAPEAVEPVDATVSEPEEVEESETSETEETEQEGEKENPEEGEQVQEEKGPKKLTAAERIQQLVEQRNQDRIAFEARVRDLEARFQQQPQQQQSDYIELTPDVQARLNNTFANLEQQRIDAELEGDYLKALEYRKQAEQLFKGLEENEKKKAAYVEKRQMAEREQRAVQDLNQRAELYRQQYAIPQEVWQDATVWFNDQCKTNPVLAQHYRDMADRQGPMAAIDWAVRYVANERSKPAQEAIQNKEEAKKKTIAASAPKPKTNDLRDDLPIDEWMKRRHKQLSASR